MSEKMDSSVTGIGSETRRRTVLAALGTAAAGSLAGCGLLGDDKSEFEQQLEAVEEATADYEDPEAALDDGYEPGGPYVPGMGWHFTHPERQEAAAEDGLSLEEPPILTYLETGEGLELGSVEYAVPAEAVEETPSLFADDEAEATEEWHAHEAATHVFALPDEEETPLDDVSLDEWTTADYWTEFSPPDEELSAGDEVDLNWGTAHGKEGETETRVADLVTHHPELETLHVWVHADNPEGVFKPVNPEYTDGNGHDHDH